MKKNLCCLVIFICMLFGYCSVANAEQHAVTFHSGDGGVFSGGVTENTVVYDVEDAEPEVKYAHTPNINDVGVQNGNYSNSVSYNTVVTIPGSSALKVTIRYGGESTSYDWACVWAGNYPSYTAYSNYSSSVSGKLGGTNGTATYTITGDTVTFGFRSDGSGVGSGYGYYAVIESTVSITVESGAYQEPTCSIDNYSFHGWNTAADGTGTLIIDGSEKDFIEYTDLYAVYEEPLIDFGVYRDVHWKLREDGTLILGALGQTETFAYVNSQSGRDWPWYSNATMITQVQFIGSVVASNNMGSMFYNCSSLTSIDFTNFSMSDVTNLGYMFYGCSSLTSLDLSHFSTESVTSMTYMFYGCNGLTSLDLSSFNTANVKDFSCMFYNCSNLSYLDLSTMDSSSATTLNVMFNGCNKLVRVKLGAKNPFKCPGASPTSSANAFLPTVNIVDGSYTDGTWSNENGLFEHYTPQQLTEAYWSGMAGYWSINVAEPLEYAIYVEEDDCTLYFVKVEESLGAIADYQEGSITSISGGTYTGYIMPVVRENTLWLTYFGGDIKHVVVVDEVAPTSMRYWLSSLSGCEDMDVAKLDVSNVTSFDYAFANCTSLTELDLSAWDTSRATSFEGMFRSCLALETINVTGLDTSHVTTFNSMCRGCTSLLTMDLSAWNWSNVTKAVEMFSGCSSLESVNLSGINAGQLSDFDRAFQNCSNLTTIDFSGFRSTSLVWFSQTFYGCSSLTSLDLSGFKTNNVASMTELFRDCSMLASLDISSFNCSKVTSMKNMYMNCYRLSRVVTGSSNPFIGLDTYVDLPTPPNENQYGSTTEQWIREDKTYGPYSSFNLRSNYTADFAGVWVWDRVPSCGYAVYVPEDDNTLYFVVPVDDTYYASGSTQTIESISGGSYIGKVYPASSRHMWITASDVRQNIRHVKFVDDMAPEDTSSWFRSLNSCVDMDLAKLDTSNSVNFDYMFYGCSSMASIDVSNFDTSNVTSMRYAFAYCRQLQTLDLSSWITSNVINVGWMFRDCGALTYLDISSFDLSNVLSYEGMYFGCSVLERFKFGDNNPVLCNSGAYTALPQNWFYYLEDSDPMVGPYAAYDFASLYSGNDKGVWVHYVIEGTPYAVFDDTDNTMYFLVCADDIDCSLEETQDVMSVSGTTVHGRVYRVDIATSRTSDINVGWGEVIPTSERVVCLDPITISQLASDWFTGLSDCTTMDLAKFDVRPLLSFANMFEGCSSLTELDLSAWTPESASSYAYMFKDCSSLQSLNLSSFTFKYFYNSGYNYSDVNVTGMFMGCNSITELDVFGNLHELSGNGVMDLSPLVSLQRIHLGQFFGSGARLPGAPSTWTREDGAYGPYSSHKFRDEYGYTYYGSDVSNKMKAGWWKRMPGTIGVYCSGDDNTLYIIQTMDSFADMTYGTVHRLSDGQAYTGALYYLPTSYDRPESATPSWTDSSRGCQSSTKHVKILDTVVPANHSLYWWFTGFKSLIDVEGLENIDTSKVTHMNRLFSGCDSLKTIDVSSFDTSNVVDMEYMFYQSPVLEEIIGIDNWDVRNVEDFTQFVSYDYKLREFIAPSWQFKQSGSINTYKWFRGCSGLEKIDIGNWDTSRFSTFYLMFGGCSSLVEADLHNWIPGSVADDYYLSSVNSMFNNCESLRYVDISSFINTNEEGGLLGENNVPIQSLTVGPNFRLRSTHGLIQIPSSKYPYKWIDESGMYGPWSTEELIANYPDDFSGTWVWDLPDSKYYIQFEASAGSIGSMPMAVADSLVSYQLPENKFRRPGAKFLYWVDNIKGYSYLNKDAINAGYYQPGDVVTLTAVFDGNGGEAISMVDGGFRFTLKKNQTAVFDNLPANLTYQVYEDTPYGWTLVADSNASGQIEAESLSAVGFGNRYIGDQCALVLSGEKFLNSERAGSGEFQFDLLDENGVVIDTTTTRAGGDIVFDALTFTEADVGRELIYTVREVSPETQSVYRSPMDENLTYDTHEEKIRVVVSYQIQGDGAIYSHTSNLNDDGEKLPSIRSIDPYSLYYHTGNMDDAMVRREGVRSDGSSQADYVNNQHYAQVIDLRGAARMHVKITYTNPRGDDGLFAVWTGEHEEARSGEWSDSCNLDNAYKSYSGDESDQIHVDEFDVYGSKLSLRYVSEALPTDDPNYNENSNFGYHMEITVSEVYLNGAQRPDGTPIGDYMNNSNYTDVVRIPGAEQLHVEVVYSAPRNGKFLVWEGMHPSVPVYTDDFNEDTALKSYSIGNSNELASDSFDVDGDSLTVLYCSEALARDDSAYTESSNYGYYMVVTPVNISGRTGGVPFVVSTPNIRADGVQDGDYAKGQDYVKVVSIPGATKLNFVIKFNMGSNDRLRLFAGNHPDYTWDTNINSVGWMTGSSDRYTYTVSGDTATLIFHADANSTGGNGYGYYAMYSSNKDLAVLTAEAFYDEDGAVFMNKASGRLKLSKASFAEAFGHGDYGAFVYEVAFVSENGQPIDLNAMNLNYYTDDEPEDTCYLTVHHIVERNDGTNVDLYTERKLCVNGDSVRVEPRSFYGCAYDHNDQSAEESFDVVMAHADQVANVYYHQVPFTIEIQHIALSDNGAQSILDTDLQQICDGDVFTIHPNFYDDYMYVSTNWPVETDSAIHGVMEKRDILVKLYYKAVRTISLSRSGDTMSNTVEIVLSDEFRGLKTAQYGDVAFVDGVGTVTLTSGEVAKQLVLPKEDLNLTIRPVDGDLFIDAFKYFDGSYEHVYEHSSMFSHTYYASASYSIEFLGSTFVIANDAGIGSHTYSLTLSVRDYLNYQYGDLEFVNGVATVTVEDGESKSINVPYAVDITVQCVDEENVPYMVVYGDVDRTSVLDCGKASYKISTASTVPLIRFCNEENAGYHLVVKYSHTPNVSDDGTMNSRFGTNIRQNDVVTIPGATQLKVSIKYGMPDEYDGCACLWAGSHPDYYTSNSYGSFYTDSLSGKLSSPYNRTNTYVIDGDSVTFWFWSSGYVSSYSSGFGYYAVIEAIVANEDP